MLFWRPFLETDGDDEIPKTRRLILTVDAGGGRTIASEKSIVGLFASRQANLDKHIDNHQVRLTRTRCQSHVRKSPIQPTASTAAGENRGAATGSSSARWSGRSQVPERSGGTDRAAGRSPWGR